MGNEQLKHTVLRQNLELAERAFEILSKTVTKSTVLIEKYKQSQIPLTDEERETLEALTARYSRTSDFFISKLLRSVDQVELTDEGSVLDRINRFKKRGVLREEIDWGELKDLRNQIAHEYLLDEGDRVVIDAIRFSPILTEAFARLKHYLKTKNLTE